MCSRTAAFASSTERTTVLASGFSGAFGGGRSPRDAAARHLKPRTVEAAFVDGVADLDVRVPVAMGAHVSRRGETGPQIGLEIVDGDERRGLPGHSRSRRVEHVRMRIDQARQDRRLRKVDHFRVSRNRDPAFRPDVGDALSAQQHHLFRQQLTCVAVEQPACPHGDHPIRRRALKDASVRSDAGRRAGAAPRCGRRLHLCGEGCRGHEDPDRCNRDG